MLDQTITVRRLPLGVNFKDTYKNVFFMLCVAAIIGASQWLNHGAIGAICGGFAALATQWTMTMIAETQVVGRQAYEDVVEVIDRAGYIETVNGLYRSRLARPFRFDSQNIRLVRSTAGVTIIGPAYMLRHVRRKLAP